MTPTACPPPAHAARDLLTHPLTSRLLTEVQAGAVATLVHASGLDRGDLLQAFHHKINAALDVAEAVISQVNPTGAGL